MKIDDAVLRRIIEGKPAGDFYPYNSEQLHLETVDDYIKACVNSFRNIPNVELHAIYDHYGSGFASYVDVFVYLRDGSSTTRQTNIELINGIHLYISRLYPVAVYGKGSITRDIYNNGISHEFLRPNGLETIPSGEIWTNIINSIHDTLNEFHYHIPFKDYLDSPLLFSATIPTVLKEDYYKVFDALFYWED